MKLFIEDYTVDGEEKGKLYLESDPMQYMLKLYNGKTDDKGNELSKTLGYFKTLEGASNHLLRMKIHESTAETLGELVSGLEDIRTYIRSKLEI